MHIRFNSIRNLALCGVGAMALTACGGGSGGGGPVVSTPGPVASPTPSPVPAPSPSPAPDPGPPSRPSPEPGPTLPEPDPTPTPAPSSGIAAIKAKTDVAVRSAGDDEEYRRNYPAFEYVHALYALDNGWKGQDVLVGVADDGVVANAELTGQIASLSRDFGTVTIAGRTTDRNVVGDSYSDHGTMIAGIVAGRDDGTGIQGIAPGARIVGLRVSDVNTTTGEETLGRQLPAALDYAAANAIKVVNISLAKVDASQPSPVWRDMVARYAAAGGLVVNSAGNDGAENVAGYLDLNAANREGWLFVVALEAAEGSAPQIADYSNRCGVVAMARCVATMGTQATMDASGRLVLFSGTSAATAQVSGAAALILGKWPQLSGVEAGKVLLNTARDLGAPGVDPVYGAGLIDVQAALSPVDPTLSNGMAQTSLAGAAMVVPDAVGGAGTSAAIKAMLAHVTVLDAYGRDYQGDLAGLVAHPERRRGSFARQFAAGAGAGATHFEAPGLAMNLGYASYRGGSEAMDQSARLTFADLSARVGGVRVLAVFSAQDAVQDEAMGLAPASDLTLAYAPGGSLSFGIERSVGASRLSLSAVRGEADGGTSRGVMIGWNSPAVRIKVGVVTEKGTLFGTPVGAGALRLGDGARTAFAELSRRWPIGVWSLDSYASVGATRIDIAGDTLLTAASPILTQRAGLSASRAALGGRVRLGIALPLVAFAGAGTLTYATSYDLASRGLVFSRERVDLTGRYDPVMSLGFERVRPGSTLRLAAAANTSVRDLRALASWRVTLP